MNTATNTAAADSHADRPAPPNVGDGARFTIWTDMVACTVIAVSKSGREVTLQEDTATLLNGFDSGEPDALTFTPGGFCGHVEGNQRYEFARNPQGKVRTVSLRKVKGGSWCWKEVGIKTTERGAIARFDHRDAHHDYNF